MKRCIFLLFFLIFFGVFKIYSVTIEDFIIIAENKNTSFMITDTKETILCKFNNDVSIKKELNNSCDNYLLDGIDIIFLGEKIMSIILQNNQYCLSSEIKIGDKVNNVYKKYNTPDYKGTFTDGNRFIDYHVKLQTDSPWKEPMYTLRFIYYDDEIKTISIFYSE